MIGQYKIYFVLRDKSSCIRVVISRFEVIELCFGIIVVTTVSYRVYITYMIGHTLGNFVTVYIINSMITPSVICVACNKCSVCCVDVSYVAHKVTAINVGISCKLEAYRSTCAVDKVYCARAACLSYQLVVNVSERNSVLFCSYTVSVVLKGI